MVARDFHTENFVLLGGVRANPWTRLFEGALDFAFRIDPGTGSASISNRNPRPGELPLYPPRRPFRAGYGRVAVVPNLSQSGKVVMIAGTDMASTEGAGACMLDPAPHDVPDRESEHPEIVRAAIGDGDGGDHPGEGAPAGQPGAVAG